MRLTIFIGAGATKFNSSIAAWYIKKSLNILPGPICIFLQDGSGDLNIYGGDWWKADETRKEKREK